MILLAIPPGLEIGFFYIPVSFILMSLILGISYVISIKYLKKELKLFSDSLKKD